MAGLAMWCGVTGMDICRVTGAGGADVDVEEYDAELGVGTSWCESRVLWPMSIGMDAWRVNASVALLALWDCVASHSLARRFRRLRSCTSMYVAAYES